MDCSARASTPPKCVTPLRNWVIKLSIWPVIVDGWARPGPTQNGAQDRAVTSDGLGSEPVRHGGHAAKFRERLPDAVDYLLFGVGRIAFEEFTEVGRHTEDESVPFVRQHQPTRVPRERPFMAVDRVGQGRE
jgi:hypothetical protein